MPSIFDLNLVKLLITVSRLFFSFFLTITSLHADELQKINLENSTVLPDWIEENRIQAQTGLFHFTGKSNFNNVVEELKALNVKNSYIRHLKLDWAEPLWPSKVPLDNQKKPILANYPNHLTQMIEDAKSHNFKLIGYYWESGEGVPKRGNKKNLLRPHKKYAWQPPEEWLCKDLKGNLVEVSLGKNKPLRGYHLDLLSGYRHFLLQRLGEMVEQGVEGLYFDERHLPKAQVSACYGSTIQKLYEQEGYILPKKNEWSDPNYRQYIRFQAEKMAEAFKFQIDGIKRKFPNKNIPFIISGTYLASYTMPHMSLKLAAISDIVKIEYLLGASDGLSDRVFKKSKDLKKPSRDTQIALGWVIARDASYGRPVHIWYPNFKSLDSLKTFIASTQAYGAITAINIPARYLGGARQPNPKKANSIRPDTPYPILKAGFKFGNKISTHMAYTKPIKEISIYLSERQRKRFSNHESYWRNQLWPVNAAFEVLIRNGLPSSITTDEQLGNLKNSNTKLLISHSDNLTKNQLQRLKADNPNLKIYLFNDKEKLSRESTHLVAINKIEKEILQLTKDTIDVKVDYSKSSQLALKPHSVFFDTKDGNKIVTVSNDFSRFAKKNYSKPIVLKNTKLIIQYEPSKVINLLTNKSLSFRKINQSAFEITIPTIEEIALIKLYR